ncbi:hypothetical protein FKM82_009551 [Ascaphus truei]
MASWSVPLPGSMFFHYLFAVYWIALMFNFARSDRALDLCHYTLNSRACTSSKYTSPLKGAIQYFTVSLRTTKMKYNYFVTQESN